MHLSIYFLTTVGICLVERRATPNMNSAEGGKHNCDELHSRRSLLFNHPLGRNDSLGADYHTPLSAGRHLILSIYVSGAQPRAGMMIMTPHILIMNASLYSYHSGTVNWNSPPAPVFPFTYGSSSFKREVLRHLYNFRYSLALSFID